MTLTLTPGNRYFRLQTIRLMIFVFVIMSGISGCGISRAKYTPKPIEQVVEELKRELNSGAGIQWRGVTEILAMKQQGVDFILVKVFGTRELDNSGIPHIRDGYRIVVEYLGMPTKPNR